jgi:hypothetical protein
MDAKGRRIAKLETLLKAVLAENVEFKSRIAALEGELPIDFTVFQTKCG